MMRIRFEDDRCALNSFTLATEVVPFHKLILGASRGFTGESL
jgi:hypothetical protein